MSSPLVSVVIPVFNGARFLAEAIASVLAQRHRPLELLIVDDGSQDDSAAIAETFGEPVRVLRHATQRGPSAARNSGVAATRGEFLAFLDCDDLWLAGKLERQLDLLRGDPAAGMCVTWTQNFWEPELAAEAAHYANHPMVRPYGGYSIPALLARRTIVASVPGFPEHLRHGECVVWFETALAAGAVLREIPEVLVRRRLHAGNMTRQEREGASEGVMVFLQHRLRTRRAGQA